MFPRCPVTVLRFCARRGAFSGRKNIYLGSGDLITHIGPLSTPQGGCSGMDCSRWVWMTMSQLGRYSHLGMCSLLGARACCRAWFFVFFALNRFIFQRRKWSLLWFVSNYILKKAEQSLALLQTERKKPQGRRLCPVVSFSPLASSCPLASSSPLASLSPFAS